jgi:PAS domain S-box-containing protein
MITWEWPLSGETVVVSSKEAERRMGVAGEAKITLARLLETIHPTDRPAVWRAMALAIEQGSPYETEFRVIERDGSTAWALGRGKVLTDQAGRPELMIGLRADITERKRTEALIAGENRVLAMIATGAPLGDVLECVTCLVESESPGLLCSIVLLHEDGKHMRVGAAPSLPKSFASAIEAASVGPRSGACGTAMYRREAVISSDILVDPLWEGCRELASVHGLRACWSMPIISPREKLLGSFAIYSREPRVPKAAETRLIEIGTQLAAIAVERKRAERESHEQQRQVRHLSRAALLGELTGTLAHELNQPLSSILSNAQAGQRLFNREPIDVAELRAILADIVAAERRATDVIERVCSMLRKGQSAMALVDLNEVLCETLQLSNGDLLAREVTVETRLTRSLPPVMADRVQLQQVLLNLCVNAGDAMADAPTGQRRLTIATGCSSNGAAVELTVTDHGVGIPADQLDQVFEPFFTSKEHHLGLGLSICRSIARAHGGRLWAANNAEGGASFHVSLPAACATCTRGQAASGREPAQTTACGLPDRRCAVPAVGSGLLG